MSLATEGGILGLKRKEARNLGFKRRKDNEFRVKNTKKREVWECKGKETRSSIVHSAKGICTRPKMQMVQSWRKKVQNAERMRVNDVGVQMLREYSTKHEMYKTSRVKCKKT